MVIGKLYEARKKANGGTGANQHTREQLPQNGGEAKKRYGTAATIAEELGVGKNTVERAEKFAQGVDALREQSPEAADKVLRGGSEKKICGLWAICLPFLFTFARNEKMTKAKMFKKHKKRG